MTWLQMEGRMELLWCNVLH